MAFGYGDGLGSRHRHGINYTSNREGVAAALEDTCHQLAIKTQVFFRPFSATLFEF